MEKNLLPAKIKFIEFTIIIVNMTAKNKIVAILNLSILFLMLSISMGCQAARLLDVSETDFGFGYPENADLCGQLP